MRNRRSEIIISDTPLITPRSTAAEGNYVRLHVGDREHELRETLTELEKKLSSSDFFRIHRSIIVNIHRIKEIQPWFHGYHRVLLENGTELRMSRYQREIARKLGLV